MDSHSPTQTVSCLLSSAVAMTTIHSINSLDLRAKHERLGCPTRPGASFPSLCTYDPALLSTSPATQHLAQAFLDSICSLLPPAFLQTRTQPPLLKLWPAMDPPSTPSTSRPMMPSRKTSHIKTTCSRHLRAAYPTTRGSLRTMTPSTSMHMPAVTMRAVSRISVKRRLPSTVQSSVEEVQRKHHLHPHHRSRLIQT